MEKLLRVLEWLGAFFLGLEMGDVRRAELEKELLDSETKRKLLENEITNNKNFDNADPVDVVNKIARGED